jgi:uncharacterized membrane protein
MLTRNYLNALKKYVRNKNIGRRHLIIGIFFLIVLLLSSLYLVHLSPYKAVSSHSSSQVEYIRARVLKIESSQPSVGNEMIQVRVLDGQGKGQIISVARTYIVGDPNSQRLPINSEILLIRDPSNGNKYQYFDRYRIPGAVTIFIILGILVIAIGRWRGLTGAVGLVISIGVLVIFVLPRIISGDAPFATCIEGSFIIATFSIYVAHGFNKRTTTALISIFIALFLVIGLTAVTEYISGVSGNPGDAVNTEQQTSLIQYAPKHIDLAGLLMGGIVIASLGVLEDVATAQAAAVDEIHKANPKQSSMRLYKSGLSVGREHIASLINTLFLVYFGVALPTIVLTVLFTTGPILVMLNNETIMEAIARTGVTSIALLLTVPLSTALAAYILPRWRRTNKLFKAI